MQRRGTLRQSTSAERTLQGCSIASPRVTTDRCFRRSDSHRLCDVGKGAASYDPITLELSHFFHPNGPFRQSVWPNPEQARAWGTDGYLTDCPIPEPFQAFRRWAKDVCAGHREIAASAYAYLVRQLKYPDTNKGRALDLLTGVRRFFSDT
jgi:hypothetical protein